MKNLKIYIIAGEPSGDALGAKLMKALKAQAESSIDFYGIGGKEMEEEGVKSLFPMSELSLMGFVEVIPYIPQLFKRINQTVLDIMKLNPAVVITIDSPGFSFRVAGKLCENKAKEKGMKLVHYVAPTVWAYKPGRAEKIAKIYDHLLVLLPFEPPYFDKVKLPNSFTGHPIIEEDIIKGDGAAFRMKHGIPDEARILCIMPGSRLNEVSRLLPVFFKSVKLLSEKFSDLCVVIPAVPSVADRIKKTVNKLSGKVRVVIVENVEEKYHAYAASNMALAKSGTGTLELSIAGVPMIIAYKVNFISGWIARFIVKVKYVNLLNLISGIEIIPEFIQWSCKPEFLAQKLEELFQYPELQKKQVELSKKALCELGLGQKTLPSEKAARAVLQVIKTSGS